MTEKLYYEDAYLHTFTAVVTDSEPAGEGWVLRLDRTAFFPEGGGQGADTGSIGDARVWDVQEKNGAILHYVDCPLPVGERQTCTLDYEQRLRRMQNHSGEHVLSGLVHSMFGYENVGFHMGSACMTMDYSGELSAEELRRVETRANEAVRADLPIRAWFPAPAELAALSYRSKKELNEAVRLVEIEGVDCCACCAPHVASTGQIGVIKLLDAERHRGGMRVTALCGLDALEDYRARQESVTAVSRLLSVPREKIAAGVERQLREQEQLKAHMAALSTELVRLRAESTPFTAGNLCIFDTLLNEIALRELVNLLTERCSGMAGAFSGNDREGYRYIIGSRHMDLRRCAQEINSAIGGRGGGSAAMLQGRAEAKAEAIRAFFAGFSA